jgi:uncharacterized protein (TIGR00730 family)
VILKPSHPHRLWSAILVSRIVSPSQFIKEIEKEVHLDHDNDHDHDLDLSSPAATERRRRRAAAIDNLLHEFAPGKNHDLLHQMIVTVCRLAADEADRGDVKVLNSALKELRYAFKVFAPHVDTPKVSVFGSARTPEDHPQYQQAVRFGKLMAEQGWMVITGAGDGIMKAGHEGATTENSFGVAIWLPFEQDVNDVIRGDSKLVNFKYFFTRKLLFVKESRAIALFPGGFGTQDEGFEALTLIQTGKGVPRPIILIDEPGGTYWQHWRTYVKAELLGNRMIDEADMDLFHVTDSAEDAVDQIIRFYRRYHSSRFVDEQMVIRLHSPLSEEAVAELNDTFADILKVGRFVQVQAPLDEEDGIYPSKTRLVFPFDRRSVGRLRQLIDRLNEMP